MKKLVLFVIISLLLSACSQKEVNIKNTNKIKVVSQTGVKLFTDDKNKLSNKKNVLSDYDKGIIALAVKKHNEKICDNLVKNNQVCKKIVSQEYKFYKLKKCDKLNYLKQKCEDEINFEKRNCNKITNELLKRKCYIMKTYDEAIKKQDKSICNKLPRPEKTRCLQNILTK